MVPSSHNIHFGWMGVLWFFSAMKLSFASLNQGDEKLFFDIWSTYTFIYTSILCNSGYYRNAKKSIISNKIQTLIFF